MNKITQTELRRQAATAIIPARMGVGASAAFTDGSVWTVTYDSYLSSLTIGADAVIRAADGRGLILTVNGTETPFVPGTYEGEIVISVF